MLQKMKTPCNTDIRRAVMLWYLTRCESPAVVNAKATCLGQDVHCGPSRFGGKVLGKYLANALIVSANTLHQVVRFHPLVERLSTAARLLRGNLPRSNSAIRSYCLGSERRLHYWSLYHSEPIAGGVRQFARLVIIIGMHHGSQIMVEALGEY